MAVYMRCDIAVIRLDRLVLWSGPVIFIVSCVYLSIICCITQWLK